MRQFGNDFLAELGITFCSCILTLTNLWHRVNFYTSTRIGGIINFFFADIADAYLDEFADGRDLFQDIVKNRSKLLSVIRKIVDDLNSFFAGEDEKDSNKPILNDINIVKEEEVERPVKEPEVESTEEVVEEDKEIFIETDLNFKSILEEIKNESSD